MINASNIINGVAGLALLSATSLGATGSYAETSQDKIAEDLDATNWTVRCDFPEELTPHFKRNEINSMVFECYKNKIDAARAKAGALEKLRSLVDVDSLDEISEATAILAEEIMENITPNSRNADVDSLGKEFPSPQELQ